MVVTYRYVLPYAKEVVWSALLDFGVLARVIPGVETLERVNETKCDMSVKVGIPLVTGTYRGTVEISDKDPFDRYRLRGEAKGRLGWVKGEAALKLSDRTQGTEVSAELTFHAGGLLAGVGQRLMEGIGKSMAREFFSALERELGGRDTLKE